MISLTQNGKNRTRSGQAIVEFIVGMVAVLTLLAALFQVASLAKTHTDVMIEARRQAAELALTDLSSGLDTLSNPNWLRDWEVGPDERPHSADDLPVAGDPTDFRGLIVERAAEGEAWQIMHEIPGNRLVQLRSAIDPGNLFGLVRGHNAQTVPLLPAARNLFYDAETVQIQSEVWIPWLKGLY